MNSHQTRWCTVDAFATALVVLAGRSTSVALPSAAPKRGFMFQVDRCDTQNHGGQTPNTYVHYRCDDSIADTDIPNSIDLRTRTVAFMDSVDAVPNPYCETLNQQLCGQRHDSFPVEVISGQLPVCPDERTGTPVEPGLHSSIDTIGDIEPLAVVRPVGVG